MKLKTHCPSKLKITNKIVAPLVKGDKTCRVVLAAVDSVKKMKGQINNKNGGSSSGAKRYGNPIVDHLINNLAIT